MKVPRQILNCLLFSILINHGGISQFYIAPAFQYSLSTIKDANKNNDFILIEEKPYGVVQWRFGIKLIKEISKNNMLELHILFARSRVDSHSRSIFPVFGIKYDEYDISLLYTQRIWKGLSIGLGPKLSLQGNMHEILTNGILYKFADSELQKQVNIVSIICYRFYGFEFSGNYDHYIWAYKAGYYYRSFVPNYKISFGVSYWFKLSH